MHCASCGPENPAGAKFCIECAAPRSKRCPSCGIENLPRAKFCSACATPLASQAGVQSPRSTVQSPEESGVRSPESKPPNPQSAFRNPQLEAEACFLKAIEIAHRQSAKSLELRAVISLSRLWQHQGKKEAAWQMLAEIYGWFTEGFDTADLREAKALIEELA
jgi:Double zinc ribbon